MNYKTRQLLGSLEVLLEQPIDFHIPYHENSSSWKPFVWDQAVSGAFTLFNFARSKGWLQQTDLECALIHWLEPEDSGTASPKVKQPYSGDKESILLTNETRQARTDTYFELADYLQSTLHNLEVFTLSTQADYNWYKTDYQWSFAVGQVENGQWIAIAPTVPNETPDYIGNISQSEDRCIESNSLECRSSADQTVDAIPEELTALISQLPPVQIYGWYDGGYGHTHTYRLKTALGSSKEEAVESLWYGANFLDKQKFARFGKRLRQYSQERDRYRRLTNFFFENFSEIHAYRFCFWEIEWLYLVGARDTDRLGMFVKSQFTYNP